MLSRLRLLIDFPQCTEPFSSLPYYQFMCLYEPTALTFLLLYVFAMCSSFFLFSLFKKAYSILKRLKDKILLRSLFPSVVSISLLVYDSGRVFVSTPKTFIIDFFKILSASSYISSWKSWEGRVGHLLIRRLVFWSGLIKSVSLGMILNLKLPLMHPSECAHTSL